MSAEQQGYEAVAVAEIARRFPEGFNGGGYTAFQVEQVWRNGFSAAWMHHRATEQTACGMCGGAMVTVRGRMVPDPPRVVCPCCMADRLDLIREYASRDYGVAYSATPSTEPITKEEP